MSNFESDKFKAASEDEGNYMEEEELDEEDGLDEIEVDTELFTEQLLRFPCFQDVPKDKAPDEVFDTVFNAYQDENLTEEQDHVVELLLHLQEEESPFNLSRAMEIWNQADRQTFLTLLKELSDLMDEDTEIDED